MKRILVALSVTGLFLAATTTTFADDAEKTIKGEAQCAKCSLKKSDACANVIVAKVEGKEVVYFLKDKKDKTVSKDFHKQVCSAKKKVEAHGTVAEHDGKHELTVASIKVVD
ncbi:MAG: DUF6370 family protein [Verrucomicrobia bacterium]|nr:DUF6370 family protein [Verrucomicrobiota bacterium]